ncbi:MAG: Ig-like domain-containing protein [Acidimicrobiales bacterium]
MLQVRARGRVGLAPFVSVTFNQPMVALGTVAQTDAADVPVTLTPALPGRWVWIGTRTVRFEHDPEVFDRLPMATSYVIEVPAGTQSATGNELAESVRVEFETPVPALTWLSPVGESLPLDPVFVATFNQRVDADAVRAITTVKVNGEPVAIRAATTAEIEADETAAAQTKNAVAGTWVAFRATEPLAPDAAIDVEIGPAVPSAEGPNVGDQTFTRAMRTYAPPEGGGPELQIGGPVPARVGAVGAVQQRARRRHPHRRRPRHRAGHPRRLHPGRR